MTGEGASDALTIVRVLGVDVDRVSYAQLLDLIETWIDTARTGSARQICTVNPEFLVDAQTDAAFHNVLEEADLRVADGVGVAIATRFLGAPVPERVTGSDGILHVAERAARQGWSLFLLGAGPGVAERAAGVMRERYPALRIVGCESGSPLAEQWPRIQARLTDTRPDILFVAFGHPKQDFWIWAHREDLACAVAIGVGGAFDYLAGITPRAPAWMRRAGLEWLHRLITQPWRWRRMLKLPIFVYLVARQLLEEAMYRGSSPEL